MTDDDLGRGRGAIMMTVCLCVCGGGSLEKVTEGERGRGSQDSLKKVTSLMNSPLVTGFYWR